MKRIDYKLKIKVNEKRVDGDDMIRIQDMLDNLKKYLPSLTVEIDPIYLDDFDECPECGKLCKGNIALKNHISYAHGTIKTVDEEIIIYLRNNGSSRKKDIVKCVHEKTGASKPYIDMMVTNRAGWSGWERVRHGIYDIMRERWK